MVLSPSFLNARGAALGGCVLPSPRSFSVLLSSSRPSLGAACFLPLPCGSGGVFTFLSVGWCFSLLFCSCSEVFRRVPRRWCSLWDTFLWDTETFFGIQKTFGGIQKFYFWDTDFFGLQNLFSVNKSVCGNPKHHKKLQKFRNNLKKKGEQE